ncbi:MAG: hypothetical protein WAL46_08880 [Nitrososphaeraceae archaeon]
MADRYEEPTEDDWTDWVPIAQRPEEGEKENGDIEVEGTREARTN